MNTSEHILACVSAAPSNAKIIKTAAQMAEAFGGELTALYVKTAESESMSKEDRVRLDQNIRLAKELGAEIVTVYGDDVAQQIIEFSRISRVTKLVLGRSNPQGRFFAKNKTVTDRIIKEAPSLDIHIIPDTDSKPIPHFYGFFSSIKLPSLLQCGECALILLLSTAFGFLFHGLGFTEANTITVYMLGVLITALVTKNYICSAIFSLASVMLFNFFFTEPKLSFIAYESGYPATFAIMLIASLITGTLANKLAENAAASTNSAYRTKIMLETNQLLQKASEREEIIKITANQLSKLLSESIVVYPCDGGMAKKPISFPREDGKASALMSEKEREAAEWVYKNGKRAGAYSDEMKEACGLYFPVKNGQEVFMVVGIETGRKPDFFESSIITSILGESALAMENLKNAREKEKNALIAKNEQLRANLLRSISHDLRTPLTSISGNTENLLSNFDQIEKDSRDKLLRDIYDDAEWLIELVENLLSISRISEGRMSINMSAQLVDEVITEALKHIKRKAKDRRIVTDFEDELLLADMDARLITQVIINLTDNAVKYTPKDTEIRISAKRSGAYIFISISDFGEGISDSEKADVFKMFYTGKNSIADCRRSLGLGLALCESIVNAHGGKLTLTDNMPCGSVFTFSLKTSEVKIYE